MWEVVKEDLMALFHSFHKGDLPLFHLNFCPIILLSKKENTIEFSSTDLYAC
jgi:hypothetical protein